MIAQTIKIYYNVYREVFLTTETGPGGEDYDP